MWGEDVMKHHNSWSHHNITWLFPGPEHHPLRKNFREKMHKEHEREMNMTDWNSDKVRLRNTNANSIKTLLINYFLFLSVCFRSWNI